MTPSEAAAPAFRLSRSCREPRCTSAPAAAMVLAEESDRANPKTWCPAPINSGINAEPMNPDAPVTKIRIVNLQDDVMSVTDVSRCLQRTMGCQPLTSVLYWANGSLVTGRTGTAGGRRNGALCPARI